MKGDLVSTKRYWTLLKSCGSQSSEWEERKKIRAKRGSLCEPCKPRKTVTCHRLRVVEPVYHQALLRGRWRSWRRNGRCPHPQAVRPGRALCHLSRHILTTLPSEGVMSWGVMSWTGKSDVYQQPRADLSLPALCCSIGAAPRVAVPCSLVSHSHHKTSRSCVETKRCWTLAEASIFAWEERKKSRAERCRCACHPLQTHILQTFPFFFVSASL